MSAAAGQAIVPKRDAAPHAESDRRSTLVMALEELQLPPAFFALHSDLPREAPGSDAATEDALDRLPPVPEGRILDLGCGPGKHTLVLARRLGRPVDAIDLHLPFLRQLEGAAVEAGLDRLVATRRADFRALDIPEGSAALIWCEGAIYLAGFAEGLRLWRPLLVPDGLLVASELTWLTDDPPGEAAEYFKQAYPGMTTVDGNRIMAEAAGFDLLDHFVLPQRAWWEEYLTPLEARMQALRPQAESDPDLAAVIDEQAQETAVVERWGDSFGYVFYLMRRAG
jgi:serine/threonine-protein kinase HipA